MEFEEATFTKTAKEKAENLPALVLPRHPLMKGVNTESAERAAQDMTLSLQLGLRGQSNREARTLVKSDYDALSEKQGYVEVNIQDLRKLFSMNYLVSLCVLTNIWKVARFFVPGISAIIIGSFIPKLPLLYWWPAGFFIGSGLLALLAAVIGVGSIGTDSDAAERFGFMSVSLKSENVITTRKPIPYGAKLRLKEAMDSNVFNSFIISYPQVESVKSPPRLDPAICGVAEIDGEEHWYLITFWDIEKDIERAKSSILRRAKKLKLRNV